MVKFESYTKEIKQNPVLSDINLEIPRGKFVGLYGRNASGKTMLLRAMSGLILPSSGRIIVNGNQLTPKNRFPESVGLIIENSDYWPYLTGVETLNYINSFKKRSTQKNIREWLRTFDLDPESPKLVKTYSLGMKQRLALAQAFFQNPDLLLLDEPTNALDDKSRQKVYDIFDEEKKAGKTIIIASHIKEDLQKCDWIVELDGGVIQDIHVND